MSKKEAMDGQNGVVFTFVRSSRQGSAPPGLINKKGRTVKSYFSTPIHTPFPPMKNNNKRLGVLPTLPASVGLRRWIVLEGSHSRHADNSTSNWREKHTTPFCRFPFFICFLSCRRRSVLKHQKRPHSSLIFALSFSPPPPLPSPSFLPSRAPSPLRKHHHLPPTPTTTTPTTTTL